MNTLWEKAVCEDIITYPCWKSILFWNYFKLIYELKWWAVLKVDCFFSYMFPSVRIKWFQNWSTVWNPYKCLVFFSFLSSCTPSLYNFIESWHCFVDFVFQLILVFTFDFPDYDAFFSPSKLINFIINSSNSLSKIVWFCFFLVGLFE